MLRHGVRSAINPIVTILGLDIGVLLGSSVLVETVFDIPGIGRLNYDRDHPLGLPDRAGHGAAGGAVHHRRQHRRRHRLRYLDPRVRYSMSADEPLLRVEDLRVEFPTEDGVVHAVDGITYEVAPRAHAGDRRRVGLGQDRRRR